jgi:SPP1 gp7 family putative phage head morphogenesis protein
MAEEHDALVKTEAEADRAAVAAAKLAEQQDGSHADAAALLALLMTRLLSAGTRRAKARATETLQRQLRALTLAEVADLDTIVRANRYGRRFAAKWFAETNRAAAEGMAKRAARRHASKALTGYRRTITTTEVSRAYSEQREHVARQYAKSTRELVYLEWDAALDRRTCPTCEGMHGTQVLAADGWSGSGPGAVHPGCRCVSLVVVAEGTKAA